MMTINLDCVGWTVCISTADAYDQDELSFYESLYRQAAEQCSCLPICSGYSYTSFLLILLVVPRSICASDHIAKAWSFWWNEMQHSGSLSGKQLLLGCKIVLLSWWPLPITTLNYEHAYLSFWTPPANEVSLPSVADLTRGAEPSNSCKHDLCVLAECCLFSSPWYPWFEIGKNQNTEMRYLGTTDVCP